MKDDTDKPLNTVGDDALEARITAWVLGEASSFEAGELEKLCAEDPVLGLFERRLRVLHGLVAEDFKAGPEVEWKLAVERRGKITDLLGVAPEVVEKIADRRRKSRGPSVRGLILALAACLVLGFISISLIGGVGESAKRQKSAVAVNFSAGGGGGGSEAPMAMAPAAGAMAELEVLRSELGSLLLEREGGAPAKKPASSYEHLANNSAFTAKPVPAARGLVGETATLEYRQSSGEQDEALALKSKRFATAEPPPPPAAMPVSPAAKSASGPASETEALAVNEPQSEAADGDRLAGRQVFLGGGVAGGGGGASRSGSDFIPTVEGVTIPGIPAAPGSQVADIVTGGMRSGDGAVNRNNIDAILNNPDRSAGAKPGEGTAALTGTFSDESLAQLEKKMVDKSQNAPAPAAESASVTKVGAGTLGIDAIPADSRFNANLRLGSERTGDADQGAAFDNLEEMGRLAGERKPEQAGADYFDASAAVTNEVAELSESAWAGKEGEKGGEGQSQGYAWRIQDESVKGLANAKDPGAATGFDGFTNFGAPIQGETAGDGTKARFRESKAADSSGFQSDVANGGFKRDLSEGLEAAPLDSEDDRRAQLLQEVDRAWDLSSPDVNGVPEKQEVATKAKGEASDEPSSRLFTRGATDITAGVLKDLDKEAEAAPLAGASNLDRQSSDEVLDNPIRSNPALAAEDAVKIDEVRRKLYIAEGGYNLGKYDEAHRAYEDVLRVDPYNKAARRGMEQVAAARADYYRAAYDQTRAQLLAEVDKAWEEPATLEAKKEVALSLMSEVVSADEPFSTFSLHVSDASFKLAQAAMERGEVPAAEGIRPEEFYNAFDYGDPAPASGEPVVCVTEQSAHPAFAQRNLMRIGVRTGSQGRGASTPLNLTLLLDNSGSMEREDRNAGLAMAVRQLSGLLKEGDTITVAGFSRQPRLLADRLPGARAQELNELIARTPSEGGTNLEEGLKLGEELAKRQFNPAAQNRVVLFTDGAANLGDARPEALQARIEGLRQQGISFDAAGFGAAGLNDKLLERLTRNGNGRYYIVDGPEDADAGFAKQLAGAFRPAAENVKVQVRFNPARVAKYKLIGFEEHRLQKEDFRNDAVDAAEMAAEEAGNALYQIETLPQGEGEVGEVSVRFRDVASGRMVERTWTIPYDAQAPAFDQATPSIQLAGLAAFTAEKLRAAPMADAVDFQQLGQVYAGVRARYPNSQPVADLGSMIGKMK